MQGATDYLDSSDELNGSRDDSIAGSAVRANNFAQITPQLQGSSISVWTGVVD
jgi:hypothetical protein